MTPLETEVGRTYLAVADLAEATLAPTHAVAIAEWVAERRHPWRSRIQRLVWGYSNAWWQAQAIREWLDREQVRG